MSFMLKHLDVEETKYLLMQHRSTGAQEPTTATYALISPRWTSTTLGSLSWQHRGLANYLIICNAESLDTSFTDDDNR